MEHNIKLAIAEVLLPNSESRPGCATLGGEISWEGYSDALSRAVVPLLTGNRYVGEPGRIEPPVPVNCAS